MTKIVFVTNAMLTGGAERVISTLSNYFVKEGTEVSIITIMNTPCEFELDSRVKCYSIYEKSGKPRRKEYAHYYNKLREQVKAEKPDIIVIMPEEISVKAIPFLKDIGIPLVVSERNNPWVMPKNKLNRLLRTIYYPKVDGIVFQTSMASSFFPKKIKDKGKVILNPLDYTRLPKELVGPRGKTIVTMGRLEEQKNQKMLIRAFEHIYKKYSDYKLIIYGNGSMKEELEEYASNILPRNSYSFENATDDVLNRINNAGIFVLSSDYEGLPNALIEAMAIGLPCISTNCMSGGPAELIDQYKNGILVDVGDDEALALAINEIIRNKTLADKLSKNAKKIKYRLDENKIIGEWEDYLNEVIRKYKRK